MVTTVTDNSPKSINTSLFSLETEIKRLEKAIEDIMKEIKSIKDNLPQS